MQQVVFILLLVLTPERIHAPDLLRRTTQSLPEPTTASAPEHRLQASGSTAPPPAKLLVHSVEVLSDSRPRVAILVDDMGYNLEVGRQLLNLELHLSFSFLPQAPHTKELTTLASERGRTILVHLPMEPKDLSWKQEPQTLHVGETGGQLRAMTQRMLAAVPAATGANNHMGSRFTENRSGMREVLSVLKEQRLFFIDSFTSAASVAEKTAGEMGLATARRRVFLDNDQQESAICRQLMLLTDLATREGQAVAIGHPNQGMLAAFTGCARQHLAKVHLVGADHIVH